MNKFINTFRIKKDMAWGMLLKPNTNFKSALNNNAYKRIILQDLPENLKKSPVEYVDITFGSETTKLKVVDAPGGFFAQPTCPHYKYQFEDLFGFGAGNAGYDPYRTVYVSKF